MYKNNTGVSPYRLSKVLRDPEPTDENVCLTSFVSRNVNKESY